LCEGDGLAAAVLESLAGTGLYTKVRDMLQSKCPRCNGSVTTAMIDYPVVSKHTIIIIKDVPAKVCSQCGEIVEVQLDSNLHQKIRRLIESGSVLSRTVEVPVYDIEDIRQFDSRSYP
jgi:YgiT-type zinc finger domain-containing protein